jgi:hypothetical protein
MHYQALIVEDDPPSKAEAALEVLQSAGRLVRWRKEMSVSELIRQIDLLVPVDVRVSPEVPDLRVRHVVKHRIDCYFLFNEGQRDMDARLNVSAKGRWYLLDTKTGKRQTLDKGEALHLARHEMKVLVVG